MSSELTAHNSKNQLHIYYLIAGLLLLSIGAMSQRIELLETPGGTSLRGLSVVSSEIIWVCGNEGTVGRTGDGGRNWDWIRIPGYETRDFRDIEAFDGSVAVVMAVGEPAILLKTINSGKTWKKVYKNTTPGMFLNAMDFKDRKNGMVIGDPINGHFFLAETSSGGDAWLEVGYDRIASALEAEVCFAASGTNLRMLDKGRSCFVSGGVRPRLFWDGVAIDLPFLQGGPTQGANSIAVWNRNRDVKGIAIVGGDFSNDSSRMMNCIVSRDGGISWIRPSNAPYGYRSCVEYITATKLITCGLNGVDISLDEGINWNAISDMGFNVCRKARNGEAVFLAGNNGRVGKLVW